MSDSARIPSFQFYPADWQGNANLRRCSHEEKGIWIDVMCILHDQSEYGIVRWPLADIATAIGATEKKLQGLVRKGVLKGDDNTLSEPLVYTPRSGRKLGKPVTLIAAQDGPIWYSSRMVRDAYLRCKRGASTRFGASPDSSPSRAPSRAPTRRQGEANSATFATFPSAADAEPGENSENFSLWINPPSGGNHRKSPSPSRRQGDGSSSSSSYTPIAPKGASRVSEARRFLAELRKAMSPAGNQRTKPRGCDKVLPPLIERHGFDALLAAAKAFYSTPEAKKDGGQFQPGLQSALRDGRIEALVPDPAERAAARAKMVRRYAAGDVTDWSAEIAARFGPAPTPAEIENAKGGGDLFTPPEQHP